MAYVNPDGTVSNSRPWHKSAMLFFWGFVDIFVNFFRTLTNPAINGRGNQYVTDYRRPGTGGPPPPPQRRVGGFKTLSDCRAPMPGGG